MIRSGAADAAWQTAPSLADGRTRGRNDEG